MLDCRHELKDTGGISVLACGECGLVQFWDGDGTLPPATGMARLFGAFTAQGRLPTLRGPGPEAILYRPPTRAARRHLEAFPRKAWLETQPGLWMSHDGEHLLLVPTDPLTSHNLGRGA